MVDYLHFNESDYLKAKNLNQIHTYVIINAKKKYANKAELLVKKHSALEEHCLIEVSQLLSEEQNVAFAEYIKHTAKTSLASNSYNN